MNDNDIKNLKMQETKITRFNELLDESQEWKVIKNYTKFKMQLRMNNNTKIGIPIFAMNSILEDIKPSEVFKLFDSEITDQPMWNPHCESVEEYNPEEGIRILRTRMKIPIVSNREFIDIAESF
mmetsp:Transcript_30190/g.26742  ORF Transcript_30190/g.26742 Transcript_30190/m.26742 type:complete len:124 (+) Transcript_30190:462-833(+)